MAVDGHSKHVYSIGNQRDIVIDRVEKGMDYHLQKKIKYPNPLRNHEIHHAV